MARPAGAPNPLVGTWKVIYGDTLSIASPLQQHPKFPDRRVRDVIT
jgi:hypothetical protein